ncbi:tetraspanin-32 isoform X1 [Cavia porcellus]|uniref:Tetraspanin n=1 Tax=Cavia porcellus TaxID=10141 RepID=H0VZZ0_CAVPO|nr:tetraspanin-32 isoform X2 [Cavia porcellus]
MRPGSRVRAAKCQMLATSFFILLLGFSVATMAVLMYCGDRFAVMHHVSLEKSPYDAVHHWVFSVGISLAALLILGASLSTTAAVKEAQGLMAGGFLCFVLVFCALLQVAYWKFHSPTQVEDAMLDTYDLVYDQAVKSPSSIHWQELVAIQDTFLCCGKRSPFGLLESSEADLCQGEEAARKDCLQSIQSFLRVQQNIVSMLTSAGLALTVYAMLLSSFLWFAIHFGYNLDRKGTYTVTSRTHGCQPQESSFFRRSQEGTCTSTFL